ncbi:uncharacterized protein LOC128210721 [Mya arenaria]|uniref:uncharacterized protein LOC128210721 n=1 Tax=Mya arenaria TaxID=6604 RepID=UPI0022E8AF23|nr:uncharacterized protein LOC128210721 [Mya arenaria]
MAYNMFEDYLGLQEVAHCLKNYRQYRYGTHNIDNHLELESLMDCLPASSSIDDRDEDLHLGLGTGSFYSQFPPTAWKNADTLDVVRSDAHNDFHRNGVELDIDEVDKLQLKIRSTPFRLTPSYRPAPATATDENVANRKRRPGKARKGSRSTECVFCKNNGERTDMYTSHSVKDESGRVLCPVLRKYTCPLCGVNGDNAHTLRYCPKNMETACNTLDLMRTRRLSTGKLNPRAIQKV